MIIVAAARAAVVGLLGYRDPELEHEVAVKAYLDGVSAEEALWDVILVVEEDPFERRLDEALAALDPDEYLIVEAAYGLDRPQPISMVDAQKLVDRPVEVLQRALGKLRQELV